MARLRKYLSSSKKARGNYLQFIERIMSNKRGNLFYLDAGVYIYLKIIYFCLHLTLDSTYVKCEYLILFTFTHKNAEHALILLTLPNFQL